MKITRQWAMPSMHTFTIEPIRQLICRYVKDGKGWIDPFAGENSPAEITNDLNPEKPSKYHMHALDFAKMLDGQYEGCLFDPPYSLTQVKECYQSIGCEDFMSQDASHFPYDIKREIARKIKAGGGSNLLWLELRRLRQEVRFRDGRDFARSSWPYPQRHHCHRRAQGADIV